jgi:hypothetical protein
MTLVELPIRHHHSPWRTQARLAAPKILNLDRASRQLDGRSGIEGTQRGGAAAGRLQRAIERPALHLTLRAPAWMPRRCAALGHAMTGSGPTCGRGPGLGHLIWGAERPEIRPAGSLQRVSGQGSRLIARHRKGAVRPPHGAVLGRHARPDPERLVAQVRLSDHVSDDRGTGVDLDDAKAKFKIAWARIRAGLTDDDIAAAHEIAEASAEALAQYETRRR